MRTYPHDPTCPHSWMLRRGIPGLVGGVFEVATAALHGGATVVRRLVDGAFWQEPGCCPGAGPRCGCHVVHHYRYEHVPPCHRSPHC